MFYKFFKIFHVQNPPYLHVKFELDNTYETPLRGFSSLRARSESDARAALPALHIEFELNDVAFFHDICLAFGAHFASRFRCSFGARGD